MPHVLYDGPAVPEAASAARRVLRELPRPDVLPPMMLEDLELAVTELVTNAVRAGSPTVTVVIVEPPPVLRVEVADRAPGLPTPLAASPEDLRGRGLGILAAIAQSWGVDGDAGHGKTVWAVFPVD